MTKEYKTNSPNENLITKISTVLIFFMIAILGVIDILYSMETKTMGILASGALLIFFAGWHLYEEIKGK